MTQQELINRLPELLAKLDSLLAVDDEVAFLKRENEFQKTRILALEEARREDYQQITDLGQEVTKVRDTVDSLREAPPRLLSRVEALEGAVLAPAPVEEKGAPE